MAKNIVKLAVRSLLYLSLSIAVAGCSVAVKKNKADSLGETFRSGDIQTAVDIVQTTSPNKNALYSLEMGQLYRLHKNQQISESTTNFLEADRQLENWQTSFSDRVRANTELISSYVLTEGFNSDYQLKNYEMSLLSQYLAINHLSQGKWDSAMVEANKMAQREKFIEATIQEKIAALEKANQDKTSGIDFKRTDNSLDSIGGYPVNLIRSPEVNQLKNSYQNASTYYLSGFIYEAQGETSLAAPGYRLAIELLPNNKLFKDSLANLDANIRNRANKKTADTLFIVESGFLPKMESLKYSKVFNFGSSNKMLTMSYPVIPRITEGFKPSSIQVNQKTINLDLVANIDAMARKELKDDMPAYITRAVTRAIAAVGVQAMVSAAANSQKNKNGSQNAAAGIIGIIASDAIANGMQSLNTADVRHWQTLPAYTFMARTQIPAGKTSLQFALPNGGMAYENIDLNGGYNVVYIRMFRNKDSIIVSKQ